MTSWWSEREDGGLGSAPDITEVTDPVRGEIVRYACRIRLPWQHRPRVRLVIRAYTATANVTVALESLRVE